MAKKNDKDSQTGRGKKKSAKNADGNGDFEAQLRAAISAVDIATSMTSPLKKSIENLLRLAAASVGCDEGSVIVREGDEGGLKFLVAIGQVADKLMGMTIPPGKGIAGFVFASGQPMAVADARQAEGFYSGIDDQTGYKTDTLLTTPLRAGEEVVGVLQFVNREGEPLVNESGDSYYPPFTPEEMDRAAYFADAIATLVEAHEASGLVENLFQRAMDAESLMAAATNGGGGAAKGRRKASPVQKWLQSVRAAPEHKDMVGMAVALREVASRGEAERQLCREVIEALERFSGKRSATSGTDGGSYFGLM